jgi:hypothetical protein
MNRPALHNLQSDFQQYLLTGEGAFVDGIVGDARIDAATRASIYYEAYRLRLAEALETDFDALRAYLGEEKFDDLCRDYVGAHVSDHYSIRHYGRHMARFLAETEPWRDEPFLAEMAAFEWAMVDAFDAADAPPATTADMEQVPPERWPAMTFSLHPSLQRLNLSWNAPAVWNAVDRKEPLPVAVKSPYPIGWMVWRQGLQIYFRSLSVDQAFALDAMRAGESFAAICEGLCEWIDAQHVALHGAGLLKQWLEDGLIRDVRAGTSLSR